MLRRIAIVGILLVGAGVLAVTWRILTLPPLCGNDVTQEAVSPDGAQRAVVFRRDCGATVGYTTQVSIIGRSDSLPNEAGNVFAAEGRPEDVVDALRWSDATTLVIVTPAHGSAHRSENRVGGIAVMYEGL